MKEVAALKNNNIIDSIKCAAHGFAAVFKTEKNCLFYCVNILIFGVINYLINTSLTFWVTYGICIIGVFSTECINTAIERVCDFLINNIDERIKFIKDIAAAGVLCWGIAFYAVEAIAIGVWICL